MSDEVKTCKRGSRIRELLLELQTYKDEYHLAAAANRQLADALDKAREENKMLRL